MSGVCKKWMGVGIGGYVYVGAGVCVGFVKCVGVVCWSWRCLMSHCGVVTRCKFLCTNNCKICSKIQAYSNVPFTLVPDCWLQVSIRKVLRPAISAQVLLGFPVSVYKRMLRWFPKLQVATACFSCSPPCFKYIRSLIYLCVHVCNRWHRASAQFQ